MPSRREFIITSGKGLFAIAAASPLWTLFTAKGGVDAADGRKFTICTPSHELFQSRLDSKFPGLSEDPIFRAVLPTSLLVTNTSGPAIKALSVNWSITTPTGSQDKNFFF